MSLAIPRKDQNGSDTPGMGNAYIEFYTIEESKEARRVNNINYILFYYMI
jgi:hypothetical protein